MPPLMGAMYIKEPQFQEKGYESILKMERTVLDREELIRFLSLKRKGRLL